MQTHRREMHSIYMQEWLILLPLPPAPTQHTAGQLKVRIFPGRAAALNVRTTGLRAKIQGSISVFPPPSLL